MRIKINLDRISITGNDKVFSMVSKVAIRSREDHNDPGFNRRKA